MERGKWVMSGGIALGITLLLLCCAEHEATEPPKAQRAS
jgi:hypothetical protein